MNKEKIWIKAHEYLSQNQDVILITIVKTDGSAPGKTGFKMMVSASGEFVGTIGGGNTEFMMVENAKKMLNEGDKTAFVRHFEHRENAGEKSSGMICSGSNTIAVVTLGPDQRDIVAQISDHASTNIPFRLCITSEGLELKNYDKNIHDFHFTESADGQWRYEENMNPQNILYIIGGGHVGLALSQISPILGFHTVVMDNRNDLDSMQKNRFAHECIVVDYNHIDKHIQEGDHSYVVIMTAGHEADKQVLEKLVDKRFKYLGMLASKRKKQEIFRRLTTAGVEIKQLERVYSPLGLSINSITPEEIAVSIIAEIIKVKNA